MLTPDYESWLDWIFKHAYGEWAGTNDCLSRYKRERELEFRDETLAFRFVERLFAQPAIVNDRFSVQEVGNGFDYLVNEAVGSHMHLLLLRHIPLESRLQTIGNFPTVYRDVFSQLCTRTLGHCQFGAPSIPNAANSICYMWWDVIPLFAQTKNPYTNKKQQVKARWDEFLTIEQACLGAMERTLEIPHKACIEGALHGLGEWHHSYPTDVERIIDSYLATSPRISKELVDYAHRAREGAVQ